MYIKFKSLFVGRLNHHYRQEMLCSKEPLVSMFKKHLKIKSQRQKDLKRSHKIPLYFGLITLSIIKAKKTSNVHLNNIFELANHN